ncbi:hypothetical protein AB6A40_011381 [Gnathostoma spinigerum]|uniref:Large ribosomal subunit protein uL11 N-terminal domain-containing protein n=1 Tax=Gnathostoma spinigerum TaxID=75299 RepID=A0ABD6EZR9_9BILA
MAAKMAARMKKRNVAKVVHGTFLKVIIRAQLATAAPPLGPQLGQRGLNVANFCNDFNKQTSHIKPGELLKSYVLMSTNVFSVYLDFFFKSL